MTGRRCLRLAVLALAGLLLPSTAIGTDGKPIFAEVLETGERVVLAYESGLIRLLSVPGLETVDELRAGSGALEGVAVSGNARWLAAADRNGNLEVWDLGTAERWFQILRASPGGRRVFLFHPRDDRLFVFQEGRLEQWDVSQAKATGTIRGIRGVERMSLSPDGRFLAVAGWCRTGCGDFGLCVYGFEERLVLAGTLEALGDDPSEEIVDLAYTADHSIVLSGRDWASLFSAGTLRSSAAPDLAERHRAIRSAPGPRTWHETLDGEWKVSLSAEGTRLYLYRREAGEDPERGFELEKLLPLR